MVKGIRKTVNYDTNVMNEVNNYEFVILANGEFPTHPVPLDILRNARHIVVCDGAIANLSPFIPRLSPLSSLVIIGDGDSVPAEYRSQLIKIDEQEDNDLTKATRYCLSHSSPTPSLRIAYLGTTGRREDHTLGNISLLMRYYRDMGIEGRIYTDYGMFTPCKGNHTFASHEGQQVSIFNFGCKEIKSEGLRWQSYAYREWWQGTLNEALSDSFTLLADGFYLVYQTYEAKT